MISVRYAVIGVGSVGSMIAYYLNRSGIEPYLVFRDRSRIRSIEVFDKRRSSGHRVRGVPTVLDSEDWINDSDIVVLAVKSYSIGSLLMHLDKLGRDTIIIATQNGFGAFETLRDRYGDRVLSIVVNHGAYPLNDHKYMVVGGSKSYIGPVSSKPDRFIQAVVRDLRDLELAPVESIEPYRWVKAIVNSAINPLTMIAGVRNRSILSGDLKQIVELVVGELIDLAERVGIDLPVDPYRETLRIAEATGDNYSSMLIDRLKCREIEIDYLNGYFIRVAERLNMDLKANRVLYNLAKYIHYSDCFAREKDEST